MTTRTLAGYKWQALEDAGYLGTINEKEYSWLLASTAASTPITLNELWYLSIGQQGHTDPTLNGRAWAWLESLGHTQGTLSEKWYAFWKDAAENGLGSRFEVTNLIYGVGGNVLGVYTNNQIGSASALGWSMTIDGVNEPLTFQNIDPSNPHQMFFGFATTTPPGSNILVSYDDGTGDTVDTDTTPLAPLTDVKANEGPGEYVFAAAGSYYMLSDGSVDNHILVDIGLGIGTATYTTPAGLALPDHEGIYRQLKAGEAPWYGSRVVENHIRHSEGDWLNTTWWTNEGSAASVDADGVVTAPTINAEFGMTITNGQGNDVVAGHVYRVTVDLELLSGTGELQMRSRSVGIYAEGNTQNFDLVGRQKISFIWTCTSTSPNSPFLIRNRVASAQSWQNFTWQIEDVTGQANQNPGEYIKSDQRAALDFATRKYSNANGNTVLNNVVTEASGAPLDPLPSLYAAPTFTNAIRDSRDLSTASWIGSAAAALDEVGLTGEPNTATTYTNTTTDTKTQTNSIPGTNTLVYTLRAWVKKTAGQTRNIQFAQRFTGVSLQQPNVSVNTDTGAEVVTQSGGSDAVAKIVDGGDWWIIHMQTTNANANTSLRLDVIGEGGVGGSNIIGQCEMHDGKTIDQVEGSAPIFTGSVAVTNPEVRLDWPIANHSNVQAAWYMEVTHAVDFPGGSALLGLMGSGTALMWERADAGFRTFDGTNHQQVPIVSTPGVPVKLGLAYAAADLQQRLTADGVNGLDVVYDGAFQNSGLTFPGALAMVRLIRNIRRYDLPYVEAKAKIDELMAL